jgi:hypothetical protein
VGGPASLDQTIARIYFATSGHPNTSDIGCISGCSNSADAWIRAQNASGTTSNGYYDYLDYFVGQGGRNVIVFNELNIDNQANIDPRVVAYLAYTLNNNYYNGGNRLLYSLFPGPSGLLPQTGSGLNTFNGYWDNYDLRTGGSGTQQTFNQKYGSGNVDSLIGNKTMLWHGGSGVFDRVALHCYSNDTSNYSNSDPNVNTALQYLKWMHDTVDSSGWVYVTETSGSPTCSSPSCDCSHPETCDCGNTADAGTALAAFEANANNQFSLAGTFLQAVYGYILMLSDCGASSTGRHAVGTTFVNSYVANKTFP